MKKIFFFVFFVFVLQSSYYFCSNFRLLMPFPFFSSRFWLASSRRRVYWNALLFFLFLFQSFILTDFLFFSLDFSWILQDSGKIFLFMFLFFFSFSFFLYAISFFLRLSAGLFKTAGIHLLSSVSTLDTLVSFATKLTNNFLFFLRNVLLTFRYFLCRFWRDLIQDTWELEAVSFFAKLTIFVYFFFIWNVF